MTRVLKFSQVRLSLKQSKKLLKVSTPNVDKKNVFISHPPYRDFLVYSLYRQDERFFFRLLLKIHQTPEEEELMKLKLAVCQILILILIPVLIPTFVAYAEEKPLTLWIMPNESPLAQKPTDGEIEKFLADNPNIRHTPFELQSDREFARTVLGQTKILELIKRYKKEKNFTGTIFLKILKWPDAFGEV